jgi:AcrR family transcriptional regulator
VNAVQFTGKGGSVARAAAGGQARRGGVRPAQRRRSAEDRRTQVVAAARKLMVRHGVDAVSMRAIAAAAGVSPAALYLYFPDKLVLMAAVVDALFEGLLAAFGRAVAAAPAGEPFSRLAALMEAYVAWGLAHPEEYRLMFMTPVVGVAGHRPCAPDGRPVSPNGAATFGALMAEVSALIAAGHVRREDPASLAEQIWASGHGLVALLTTFPEFEWSDREALLRGMRETMLRGIAA